MRSRGVLRLLRSSYFVLTQPDRFATDASRSLFCKPLERANRLPVVAEFGARVVAAQIEEEVPRATAVVRVRNCRPAAALQTGIVE